jgi:hypothetical protein
MIQDRREGLTGKDVQITCIMILSRVQVTRHGHTLSIGLGVRELWESGYHTKYKNKTKSTHKTR